MSFGFPAYSTGSQRFHLTRSDLLSAVGQSLRSLGWHYETHFPNKFIARNSPSISSWGEKIAIEMIDDGTVTAKSECLLATQCFDWGKNSRNVEAFFGEVHRVASAHGARSLTIPPYDEECRTPIERV